MQATVGLTHYAYYSYLSDAVVLFFGALTATAVLTNDPLTGLFERIAMGAYLVWMIIISARLYTYPPPNKRATATHEQVPWTFMA